MQKNPKKNPLSNNVLYYNSLNYNLSPKLSKIQSKVQIFHNEKSIHDLSLKNTSLTNRIEKLLLLSDKSNALIDSQKTENDILKSQLINQTNNNKISEERNLEHEKKIQELKAINEKIEQNNKIKYDSLNKEISEKEKKNKNFKRTYKSKGR